MADGKPFSAWGWSPDERFLTGTPSSGPGVYIYSIEDGEFRRIVEEGRGPTEFLPDGEHILYERDDEIWVTAVDGSLNRRLFGDADTLSGYAEGYVYYVNRDTRSDIWLLGE